MTEPDGILGGSPGPVRGYRAVVRRELERFLAIRHTGDVLLGGASGAGSLLLNTKASQEAACSRAPAAIVPGRVPCGFLRGGVALWRRGPVPADAP